MQNDTHQAIHQVVEASKEYGSYACDDAQDNGGKQPIRGQGIDMGEAEKHRISNAQGGQRFGGDLGGNDRHGGHAQQDGGEMLMQLLHGKEDGTDGGGSGDGEAGRCAACHDVAAPASMLFLAEALHNAVTHGGTHLHTGALRTQGKSCQEGEKGGDGQQDHAVDPAEAENTLDGGHRGGNTAASTAMRSGEDQTGPKTYEGGSQDEQGETEGMATDRLVGGTGDMDDPLRQDLKGYDEKGREEACDHGENEAGQEEGFYTFVQFFIH